MKIAIIGAGRVGDPTSEKVRSLVSKCGPHTKAVTVRESPHQADIFVLATPWSEVEGVIRELGNLTGKILIDATNPIIMGAGEESRWLLVGQTTSAGEEVAKWAPAARVVKAFNTTGSGNMENPLYGNRRVPVFVAGDDAAAKATTSQLARDVGLEPIDVGLLSTSRLLEPMALLWIKLAYAEGWGPDFAFDLLKRNPQ